MLPWKWPEILDQSPREPQSTFSKEKYKDLRVNTVQKQKFTACI